MEGRRGSSAVGDIAIDDLSFTNDLCGGEILHFYSSDFSLRAVKLVLDLWYIWGRMTWPRDYKWLL